SSRRNTRRQRGAACDLAMSETLSNRRHTRASVHALYHMSDAMSILRTVLVPNPPRHGEGAHPRSGWWRGTPTTDQPRSPLKILPVTRKRHGEGDRRPQAGGGGASHARPSPSPSVTRLRHAPPPHRLRRQGGSPRPAQNPPCDAKASWGGGPPAAGRWWRGQPPFTPHRPPTRSQRQSARVLRPSAPTGLPPKPRAP